MITNEALKQIMPKLPDAKRAAFLPPLQGAMNEFSVNTPKREAAFLAQIAHESGEFTWMEEIWGPTAQQRKYEPPSSVATSLGNTQAGDGKRFKGRGPIQVTGRANYAKYGSLLGLDLISAPEKAATPEVGFRVAGLYWQKNELNELADREMFETITRRINGGLIGLAERQKYYAKAKQVLGVPATRGLMEPEAERDVPLLPEFTRGREVLGAEPPRRRPQRQAKRGAKMAAGKKTAPKTAKRKTTARGKSKAAGAKKKR